MWDSLVRRSLRDHDMSSDLLALQEDSLRLLIRMAATVYLGWHFLTLLIISTPGASVEVVFRYWVPVTIVMASLAASYQLEQRQSRLAAEFFVWSSLVSNIATVWLLVTPAPAFFLPLLIIVGVVLIRPIGGFALLKQAELSGFRIADA